MLDIGSSNFSLTEHYLLQTTQILFKLEKRKIEN